MDVTFTQTMGSDFEIIKNLVLYCIYDMAEYMGWDCNAEGRYDGCDDLPEYTRGDFVRSAETYLHLDSGSWAMQFYRFESRGGGR